MCFNLHLHVDGAKIYTAVFINFIIYLILKLCVCKFCSKGTNKSFSISRFSSIMSWIHFYIINLQPWFPSCIVKLAIFIRLYFVCLPPDSNFNTISVFQRHIPCIFTKISLANNKKQIPLLNLLINSISAQSALQILSLEDEYTVFQIF